VGQKALAVNPVVALWMKQNAAERRILNLVLRLARRCKYEWGCNGSTDHHLVTGRHGEQGMLISSVFVFDGMTSVFGISRLP
jgi:hypothetical protein